MTVSMSNGHSNGQTGTYKQSDEQIWKKVNKSLLNIGVPVTPILIRRAEGVSMFVSLDRLRAGLRLIVKVSLCLSNLGFGWA